MPRLLIFETAYRPIAEALAPMAGRLDLLLMNDAGEITLNGQPVSLGDAQPDLLWTSGGMYFGPAAGKFVEAALASRRLEWAHSQASGLDHPLFPQLAARGVRLSNSHGQAVCIAEYVVAEVLAHFQRIAERRAAQAARRWDHFRFREIRDSHWLIVGFGAIGAGVAERIRGFGPTITGVRRTPGPHPLADEMVPLSQAAEAARRADVVVLAAPAGADTDRLVDAAFLAGMKSGSVLVNVGRGTLVDETALLQALDRGTPEFAILDVFDKEPLPADSPFWAHPRIALTGHASSYGEGLQRRNDALFVENLRRYLAGEPLLNLVDPRDVPRGPAS